MFQSSSIIEHQGIVESITLDTLGVRIQNASACSQCHAKKACLASESVDKIIEVKRDEREVSCGDCVTLVFARSLGMLAVALGYLIPFALVFFTLALVLIFTKNEVVAGLAALGILAPYYTIVYLLRNRIKTKFQFQLKR